MASTNTCAVPVSYMNKLQIFFSSIQSYEKLRLMKKKNENGSKLDYSWNDGAFDSIFLSLSIYISKGWSSAFLKKIYSVNILVDLSKWISLFEGTWNGSKESLDEKILSAYIFENLKK